MITGARHRVSVDGYGVADGHGGLRLDQAIREAGKAPRARLWILHPTGPNRWTRNAHGRERPGRGRADAGEVVITYRMKNGANVEQHLQLPPGGIAQNHMEVTRLGLKLATLDERIRKPASEIALAGGGSRPLRCGSRGGRGEANARHAGLLRRPDARR